MTLVRKVCPFLKAKSAVAQLSKFFELGSDIKRLFGSILELYFPKCAPKVCAPRRHTGCPQISENSTEKSDFRRFSCRYCAVWVHILGRALFVRWSVIIGVKHISIPASNSKNFKSYGCLKIVYFHQFQWFPSPIVGKTFVFFSLYVFPEISF